MRLYISFFLLFFFDIMKYFSFYPDSSSFLKPILLLFGKKIIPLSCRTNPERKETEQVGVVLRCVYNPKEMFVTLSC